jgi:lysophosphatidate acyltransferase
MRGMEHLSVDKSAVILANHQSMLDILGMLGKSKFDILNFHSLILLIIEMWETIGKMTVIARMLLLFAGPFGIGSWLCGLEFINKSSADSGKQKMNETMEKLKEKNIKLWVFPEGYRNRSGNIDEFKKGAFHMAIRSQVPIIPVIFSSYKFFMSRDKKYFNRGDVIVEALPEISTHGLSPKDVDRLIRETREQMITKFDELNREISNKMK